VSDFLNRPAHPGLVILIALLAAVVWLAIHYYRRRRRRLSPRDPELEEVGQKLIAHIFIMLIQLFFAGIIVWQTFASDDLAQITLVWMRCGIIILGIGLFHKVIEGETLF
jgi:uncharacterized membrane protein